jgi:hypothetical protein
LCDVEIPPLYRQSAHRWRKVVSPAHRPHLIPQKNYFPLLVLISVEDSEPQGLVLLAGLGNFMIMHKNV